MKKIIEWLRFLGTMTCTGIMAVGGLIAGIVIFKPENMTVKNKK